MAKSKVKKKSVRKKAVNKRSAKQKQSTGVLRRWLWRCILLLIGLGVGFLLPWLLVLDHQIKAEFEGRKWDLPSRVYARPLSLFVGSPLSARDLTGELQAAGYRQRDTAAQPGQYASSGNRFDIYLRSFEFDDGKQTAYPVSIILADNRVTSIRNNTSNAALELVRLDPAEIASVYPLDNEDRTLIQLADVPELLVTGLQAVEDRKFNQHHGVDFRGILRAMWANLKARKAVQGGSTLTQQLVKNYFLSHDRKLVRKINEALMAVLLELHYDKAEILQAYINEIFLGQQGRQAIHGFARASTYYFGQPLERLETHQLALLIGMVKGASWYNPRRQPERALERRDLVLKQFYDTGLIGQSAYELAVSQPLEVTASPPVGGRKYNAFVDLVKRQLRADYAEQDLRREGLRIFTTLAPTVQQKTEQAVVSEMPELAERGLPESLQTAAIVSDVISGEVLALVGDRNPQQAGFNRALDAYRQVGSVIKPLVYLLALQHDRDYSLVTPVPDEVLSLKLPNGDTWTPRNYDEVSHGEIPLIDGLVNSYNQATVGVGLKIGVRNVLRLLKQLGVERDFEANPSTLLGAVELSTFEVAQMYQSLAAGGYTVPLRAVTAVMTAEGKTLKRYPLRMSPLAKRDAIALLNYALTQVVQRGTARSLPRLLGRDVAIAGKTGTTNAKRDSWFAGYTQEYVGVVWVGNDDNTPAGVTGSNAALRVWAEIFQDLPITPIDLRLPDNGEWVWVDPQQAALTDPSCPGAQRVPFMLDSAPRVETDCLQTLRYPTVEPISEQTKPAVKKKRRWWRRRSRDD